MNAAPAPSAATAGKSIALRFVREALAAFLGLALVMIVGLALSATLLKMDLDSASFGRPLKLALGLTAILGVLAPLILIIWAERRNRLGWKPLGLGWLLVAPTLWWLAWDDPAIRRPMTLEEIAPSFTGADMSYSWLMRYSKQNPGAEVKAFAAQKPAVQFAGATPRDPAKWRAFLTDHRTALEADWTMLAPQRAWLAKLNTFERIGDLTPADFDADNIRYDVWRVLAQRTCAQASLQALDGRGDEAVTTLLPMLEVSRKLEPSSRTLVRFMIARIVQRICLETAGFIIDQGTLTSASRQRLATALEGGNSRQGARRIVLLEYAIFTSTITAIKFGDQTADMAEPRPFWHRPLVLLSNLIFNFHATANRYGDFIYELATLAEARDLGGFSARQQDFNYDLQYKSGMKNLGGTLVLSMTIPAYDKVIRSYWEIEDLRTALLARLLAPGA